MNINAKNTRIKLESIAITSISKIDGKPRFAVNHQEKAKIHAVMQKHDMENQGKTECRCGEPLTLLSNAYQCFYCKEWWCESCAPDHFGMTMEEWEIKESQK